MNWLDLVQWPAMLVTLAAAWMVASRKESFRAYGFWVFLLSNLMWIIWASASQAWALLLLQVGLAAMNIRGARKNDVDA